MVLCLPILLFVMALMINFGTVACWKIRADSVARQAVWGSRFPRIADANPRPGYWPETASVTAGPEDNAPLLDDPRVYQPVARGPLPLGATVNESLLDPTRGFRQGTASLDRYYPMLRKMGAYQLEATNHLADDKWQYPQMGLSSNWQRRIPVIYVLAKASPSLVNTYIQAANAILDAPFQPQLRPLDNDDEFIYYSNRFGWGTGPPDFHPRLRQFDTLDLALAAERVQDLIDRIQGNNAREPRVPGVPERMTEAFIRLYQRVIEELRNQPNSQAEIAQLEAKIKILEQFKATLAK
jgi:hypothetical protein